MANTYTQLYIQFVFAVKDRQSIIPEVNRKRVEQYICALVSNRRCQLIAIHCNPDHVHLFIALHKSITIVALMQEIKSLSSSFINKNQLSKGHFEWQTGYGAFSYGQSQIDAVCKYIDNQPIHHKNKSFREEYLALLKAFEIEYDERYVLGATYGSHETDEIPSNQ